MRSAVRAIIFKEDQLLVMHRNKFGQQYDTLIGGGIEISESPEEALYREIKEETGVNITNPKLVFIERAEEPYGMQFVYLCEYVSGNPVLNPSSIEAKINELGQNLYLPKWCKLSDLGNVPFKSDRLKQAIIKALAEGFPTQPLDITEA